MSAVAGTIGRIDAWLDKPATLIADWWRALRPRRRLEASVSADGQTLFLLPAGGGSPTAELPLLPQGAEAGSVADRLSQASSGRPVAVTLPAAWIVERRIELPLEAASHLSGIVVSRLNALSPLPQSEILHGHLVTHTDSASGRLHVTVAIVPRSRLATLLGLLAKAAPREIELRAPLADGRTITLMSGQTAAGKATIAKIVLALLLAGAVAGAAVAAGASAWASSELAEQRVLLERRAAIARNAIADASEPVVAETLPEQAAQRMKAEAVSIIGALDDLADALPLHAHAIEINLERDLLRLAGRTSDLPDVLTALESSGRFVDSRLVGTATRTQDGAMSDFVLQTRPLARTGGDLP